MCIFLQTIFTLEGNKLTQTQINTDPKGVPSVIIREVTGDKLLVVSIFNEIACFINNYLFDRIIYINKNRKSLNRGHKTNITQLNV